MGFSLAIKTPMVVIEKKREKVNEGGDCIYLKIEKFGRRSGKKFLLVRVCSWTCTSVNFTGKEGKKASKKSKHSYAAGQQKK